MNGTFPIALCQHLKNHQVTFIERSLAFQRDSHTIEDRVGGHHHTALADRHLVDSHIDDIGRDNMQIGRLRTLLIFQDVLQFKGIVAELFLGSSGCSL